MSKDQLSINYRDKKAVNVKLDSSPQTSCVSSVCLEQTKYIYKYEYNYNSTNVYFLHARMSPISQIKKKGYGLVSDTLITNHIVESLCESILFVLS